MTLADRRQARQHGQWGEWAALWYLRLKGYGLVARGYGLGRGRGAGEVDLIVRRGRTLVFVEVKTRRVLELAAQAVGLRQRQRIVKSAGAFLAANPAYADYSVRFDAVLVAPWRCPRHLVAAWDDQGDA